MDRQSNLPERNLSIRRNKFGLISIVGAGAIIVIIALILSGQEFGIMVESGTSTLQLNVEERPR